MQREQDDDKVMVAVVGDKSVQAALARLRELERQEDEASRELAMAMLAAMRRYRDRENGDAEEADGDPVGSSNGSPSSAKS